MALENFVRDFNINEPTSTRFCLGGDVYISITFYRGDFRVHVRRFNTITDTMDPERVFMFPSKTGLMLSTEQINNLYETIPIVLSLLERDAATKPTRSECKCSLTPNVRR